MDDPSRYADSKPGAPRWVKRAGIVIVILALLIAAVMLLGGGGEHGPGRHTQAPPSAVTAEHAPPAGVLG